MPHSNRRKASRRPGLGPIGGLLVLIVFFLLSSQFKLSGEAPEGVQSVPMPAAQGQELPLQVYFFDVGQGDSQLVRIPGESGYYNMLIDTGEYQYADGLTSRLQELGVEKLHALVCTHPHTDHMGCMARIVQRFDIGEIYMPLLPEDKTPTTTAYEKLLDAVAEKGLTIIPLHEGSAIESPAGSALQVVAPRVDTDWDGANNYSAVIRLVYGEASFLFTGDAEEESEEVILEDGHLLASDVLKCGHHGSSTSTSGPFLQAVDPLYAVISCGEGNSYGHPHRETLEKLNAAGVLTYRTDQDGTLLAESCGSSITWTKGLAPVQGKD